MRVDDLRRLIDEYFDKEDYERTLEYCDSLSKEHASERTTEDIFKQALCHYKLDDNNSAITCFDSVLEREPDNILALTNKGICLYALKRVAEAFAIFNGVLKTNPNVFPAWYYIGYHYLPKYTESGNTHDLAILINAFRRVVEMAPDFGAFPIYDPVKKIDYRLDTFILLHDEIKCLSIDEMTAL